MEDVMHCRRDGPASGAGVWATDFGAKIRE